MSKLANPAKRATEEWIGASPDTPIPPRVKLRIWEREEGRCYLTGRKIMPGDAYDFEHVVSIANGGENRERNLRLALAVKHREKTAADRAEQAKTERTRKKHLGLWPKSPGFRPDPRPKGQRFGRRFSPPSRGSV